MIIKKVFISYPHNAIGKSSARSLYSALRNENISTYFAEESIALGQSWLRQLREALEGCEIMLVLISSASHGHHWSEKEFYKAQEYPNIQVIPVLVEDTILPIALADLQAVSLFGDQIEEQQKRLFQLIRKKLRIDKVGRLIKQAVIAKRNEEYETSLKIWSQVRDLSSADSFDKKRASKEIIDLKKLNDKRIALGKLLQALSLRFSQVESVFFHVARVFFRANIQPEASNIIFHTEQFLKNRISAESYIRSCQDMFDILPSALPNAFPPAWAELWGEDEYGLFADMVFRAEEFGTPNASENKSFQNTSEESGQLPAGEVIQRFRWIAAGDFFMGSPEDEPGRCDWEDQHKVTLTQGYWSADTTVTQALWKLVVGENPARFEEDLNNPVEKVSWDDSQEFINSINQKFAEIFGGLVLRLPTEAEWEHACRVATTTPFSFGDNVTSDHVNFDGSLPYNKGNKAEDRNKTVVVKSLPPNAWGLYEMHGNVWEWCEDAWKRNLGSEPMVDPYHSDTIDALRVRRGGSWSNGGRNVRSAYRRHRSPADRADNFGLRLSLGPELKARSAKKE